MKRLSIGAWAILFAAVFGACQSEQTSRPPIEATATNTRVVVETLTPLPATPSATATPRPSWTPTLTPFTGQTAEGEVRLTEDFSRELSCLQTFENETVRGGIEEGAYVLEVLGANVTANVNCETVVVGDFSLEVDVSVLEAPEEGTYSFGLLFRISGAERYAFVLGSEGGYCAYFANDQALVTLTNSTDYAIPCWVRIPEEALGEATLHLQVVAVDERIDLLLNGVLLGVVRDSRLSEGWVGFVAGTAGAGGLKVEFDNLRVTKR